MEKAVVIHKMYGRGIVTVREEKMIRVQFEREGVGEKSFVYPDSFRCFLHFEDEQLTARVNGELERIRRENEERAAQKAAERAAWLESEKRHQKVLTAAKRKSAARKKVRSTAKKAEEAGE